MLEHVGEKEAHDLLMKAVEDTLQTEAGRTQDLGGKATTESCEKAILSALPGA